MNPLTQKILGLIVFAAQALSLCVMARGVFLCVHADGQRRIESVADATACASDLCDAETAAASVSPNSCVDVPLLAHDVIQSRSARSVALDPSPFEVPSPSFLVPLAEPRSTPGSGRDARRSLTPPELEQRSLRSVILVI